MYLDLTHARAQFVLNTGFKLFSTVVKEPASVTMLTAFGEVSPCPQCCSTLIAPEQILSFLFPKKPPPTSESPQLRSTASHTPQTPTQQARTQPTHARRMRALLTQQARSRCTVAVQTDEEVVMIT